MKVVIIDDNEVDLEGLKITLATAGDYELAGTASTLDAGLALVHQVQPDVILLDVQLGDKISLDHLDKLTVKPHIICTTLYDNHALQAFDKGVIDYLIKPVSVNRLRQAFDRIPSDAGAQKSVTVTRGVDSVVIPLKEILVVASDNNYSSVTDVMGETFLSNFRMREWAANLLKSPFFQLDRSLIVNRLEVQSFTRISVKNRSTVRFRNGHEIVIGRSAYNRLRSSFKLSV